MSDSLNLYRLQKLDTAIDQKETRLEEIEIILNDNQELIKAKKKLEKAKAIEKEIRIQLNQIVDKVESQRIKRKTNQASLFSSNIKNPKALQDLQMESEALARYIAQLEDQQLEKMIAFEEAENTVAQAAKTVERIKVASIEENAALLGERSKHEDELSRLHKEKQAVIQSIPQKTRTLYTQLRKTKRGVAVASVSDGGCSICGQALNPANLQSIRSGSKLIFCPSCGRILYEG
jgi:predicted  nucleic acid-binding Zn-ribbon protein